MKKKTITLKESDLHRIIKNSVKNILKESKSRIDWSKFDKWENETHIPQSTLNMINYICEKLGATDVYEETITINNRYGESVGWAKGFTLSYCTSSYENGPSIDYSKDLLKFIKGLGFSIENSYGDNGMDSSTNYQDTFWNYDFIYNSSVVYKDNFMIWGNPYDEDNEDDDDEYYEDSNW